MLDKLHEMLAHVFEKELGFSRGKAVSFAVYFDDIDEFVDLEEDELDSVKYTSGNRAVHFSKSEKRKIFDCIDFGWVDPQISISENYTRSICRYFVSKQLKMIRSLTIDSMHPNPFLMKALQLNTPQSVIQLNVYMATTRSIVTSMGYLLQELFVACSEVMESHPSGFDGVKTKGHHREWFQIKSGTNDMDKDQIVYWNREIGKKIKAGDLAFIGMAYGKKTDKTVTLGLIRQHLSNWEKRILIGRELWDYAADDSHYHDKLLDSLKQAAESILGQTAISQEIEKSIVLLTKKFKEKYGDGAEGVDNYIRHIF